MRAWYNENDPYAAAWLSNLIGAGEIADGEVDGRSIVAVSGIDLGRFDQCHFFAGLGGWSHALRLAGWPEGRAVWTGSCPCQPFSGAGRGGGFADERHLWPAWLRLIRQHRPCTIFGEQVASPAGRAWLDLVFTDLEGIGYTCGAVVFPAAGVGAPHGRHRIFLVADAASEQRTKRGLDPAGLQPGEIPGSARPCPDSVQRPSPVNGFWRDAEWLRGCDNRWRAVEPQTFPLANRTAADMGRLRAYGNAIVPQAAAEFVGAYLDLTGLV